MSWYKYFTRTFFVAAGVAAMLGAVALADVSKNSPSADQPEMKLPPGWTAEDMQACILAGTPGEQHEHLAKSIGQWHGTTTMWMTEGAEPMESECQVTVTPMMDGRYTKIEWKGDMPGMGPYHGFGINGFDNVSQEFVSIWLDNHSTGLMKGVGKISPDGKTLSWEFTHNCPITKKPTVMREIETVTGPNTKTLEMFATDPKSGKEYKMMRVELTKE
jgi:hypothetical protein